MKGDFTGFSFDGIHCSTLNLVRVANGDRYDEELFPEIEDKTNEIVGGDGENYYESSFRTKTFSLSVAFDSVTETQFRMIRKIFGTKKICELIFDERPYKVYSVKLAKPIELNYICFDEHKRHEGDTIEGGGIRYIDKEGERVKEDITPWVYEYDESGRPITERIYKGEGTIEFVAYYPFARQLYKVLDLYEDSEKFITTYDNVDEWADSSRLLTQDTFNRYNIDKTIKTTTSGQYNLEIPVYNPGDLNVGFYLYIPFVNNTIKPNTGDYVVVYGDENGLILDTINKKGEDTGIIINTVNHLIEGVRYDPLVERIDFRNKTWEITHNIYNEHIKKGDFPKILRSDLFLDDSQYKQAVYLNCLVNEGDEKLIQINYDYLYF